MSQVVLSGATAKLDTWKRQGIPADEFELAAYREIVTQAVFSKWNLKRKSISLFQIYLFTHDQVTERIRLREWPHAKFVRSKRFVDRRVNEAASQLYAENGIPKICAVTAGIYQPNPVLFAKEAPKK